MGAPVIEWIRDGVGFTPPATASFRRGEADLGRRIDVNSTYRDYNTQLSMWRAWQAYIAGTGPYPGHSRALHPDASMHCQGVALDSDDWRSPGFISFMAERGWIRTAANDPTEQHHFEYQWWMDQHRNRPAGGNATPLPEDDMFSDSDRKLLVAIGADRNAAGQVAVFERVEPGYPQEWMYTDPTLPPLPDDEATPDDEGKQDGYRITQDGELARVWGRQFSGEDKVPVHVSRADYIKAQEFARERARVYRAAQVAIIREALAAESAND